MSAHFRKLTLIGVMHFATWAPDSSGAEPLPSIASSTDMMEAVHSRLRDAPTICLRVNVQYEDWRVDLVFSPKEKIPDEIARGLRVRALAPRLVDVAKFIDLAVRLELQRVPWSNNSKFNCDSAGAGSPVVGVTYIVSDLLLCRTVSGPEICDFSVSQITTVCFSDTCTSLLPLRLNYAAVINGVPQVSSEADTRAWGRRALQNVRAALHPLRGE